MDPASVESRLGRDDRNPHAAHNFLLVVLSVPHLPQRIGIAGNQANSSSFGAIGLAILGLPGGRQRRVWLAAALILLLASGAPGCGSTVGGGGDQPTGSSAQSFTAVSAFALTSGGIDGPPVTTVTGLPIDLGSITRD